MNDTSPALNGRSKAVAYRKSRMGGSGSQSAAPAAPIARRTRAAKPAAAPVAETVTPKATTRRTPNAPVAVVAAGREAAKQRRKAQVSGKATSSASAQARPSRRIKEKPEPVVQPRSKSAPSVEIVTTRKVDDRKKGVKQVAPAAQMSKGRQMSKAWRSSLVKGKAGQTAYKTTGSQSGALARMSNPDASSREIAKQVRADRCSKGGCTTKGSDSNAQRRGRQRPTPEKVVISETLRGQQVSGSHVGQGKMTGAETGSCQLVSGTEYLGAEEFATHCETVPAAAPAKVSQSSTTRGQVISGSEVGRSESVTGDLAGQCQGVTGTEYLPADQSEMFCQTDGASKPMQTSVMPEKKGNTGVTGGEMSITPSVMITGADRLTLDKDRMANPRSPQKVVASRTLQNAMTTGTQVGRNQPVTGDNRGYCASVTGSSYQSLEEVEGICQTTAPKPARKQGFSITPANQIISGERAGAVIGLTGAEAGACNSVTGTPYMGVDHVAEACSTDQVQAINARQTTADNKGAFAMSGTQPGVVGLTGAQKGACKLVTGTDYQSAEQTTAMCESTQAATPGESDFPIVLGGAEAAAQKTAAVEAPEAEANRASITGDGWDRGSKVTGTEGHWAMQRNPSIKGRQMPNPMGARDFRPTHMEEVPQSPITGSSGNTGAGAKVTLSGGARA